VLIERMGCGSARSFGSGFACSAPKCARETLEEWQHPIDFLLLADRARFVTRALAPDIDQIRPRRVQSERVRKRRCRVKRAIAGEGGPR